MNAAPISLNWKISPSLIEPRSLTSSCFDSLASGFSAPQHSRVGPATKLFSVLHRLHQKQQPMQKREQISTYAGHISLSTYVNKTDVLNFTLPIWILLILIQDKCCSGFFYCTKAQNEQI